MALARKIVSGDEDEAETVGLVEGIVVLASVVDAAAEARISPGSRLRSQPRLSRFLPEPFWEGCGWRGLNQAPPAGLSRRVFGAAGQALPGRAGRGGVNWRTAERTGARPGRGRAGAADYSSRGYAPLVGG